MTSRVIDQSKCIGCGQCVNDCINQYIILVDDENGKKKATFKERGRCLECGHCNAICPQRAVSGGNIEELVDCSDSLLTLMGTKRTIRSYKKGSNIPQDKLEKIIMAGQSAPTDRNRRSARIILIKDDLPFIYSRALDWLVEEVEKTGRINPLYFPTMELNAKRDEILWNAEYLVTFIGLPANLIDAAIAAERMQLEAWRLGVGTGYRGDMKNAFNHVDDLRDTLGIKKNEECLLTFAMGLTDRRYLSSAVKNNRKIEIR